MGSESIKEMGLERDGDRTKGDPWQYTIIGVDISRTDLLARYEGKPTEQALINGIKQDRRSRVLAPPWFVESCESGVDEPVHFLRLKKDNQGKEWLVIIKGNNRCAALRIVNENRKIHGHPPFPLPSLQAERPGSGEKAGNYAREQHALSNVRAKMLPSHKAEVAGEFRAQRLAPHQIVRYLDSVTSESEVLDLLALDLLIEPIKDAVDSGKVPIEKAVRLVKGIATGSPDVEIEERQAEWLAARLAPKARKPRPEVRPLPPKKIAALARELRNVPTLAPLLSLLLGETAPKDITDPDLRAAALRALGDGS